ncbi:3178_t:CDS:1, partial [Scutellospora calospora]
QEQKPLKIKEKCIISNCQVRYQPEDTSNSKESSNMINEVALMNQDIAFIGQDIGSTYGETSDNETYNFSPLPQSENLQFFVKQLLKDFYNAKLSLFYSSEDLLFFSDDNNKNDNMRSDKDYETEEESEEED